MHRSLRAGLALFALGICVGCGGASGPHVRVATATAAELAAVQDEDNVWYEFQAGDVVPVQFGFFGAVEGGTDAPAVLRAKQRFFFVVQKNQPLQISFDGKTFAGESSRQSVIAVLPRKDGKGGQLGWLIYMGEGGDPEKALKELLEAVPAQESQPQPAAADTEAAPPSES